MSTPHGEEPIGAGDGPCPEANETDTLMERLQAILAGGPRAMLAEGRFDRTARVADGPEKPVEIGAPSRRHLRPTRRNEPLLPPTGFFRAPQEAGPSTTAIATAPPDAAETYVTEPEDWIAALEAGVRAEVLPLARTSPDPADAGSAGSIEDYEREWASMVEHRTRPRRRVSYRLDGIGGTTGGAVLRRSLAALGTVAVVGFGGVMTFRPDVSERMVLAADIDRQDRLVRASAAADAGPDQAEMPDARVDQALSVARADIAAFRSPRADLAAPALSEAVPASPALSLANGPGPAEPSAILSDVFADFADVEPTIGEGDAAVEDVLPPDDDKGLDQVAAVDAEAAEADPDPQPAAAPVAPPRRARTARPAVRDVPPPPPGPARVTADVNLRAGPAKDAAVIMVVPAKTEVRVLSCKFWCDVTAGTSRGWIYKTYLRSAVR